MKVVGVTHFMIVFILLEANHIFIAYAADLKIKFLRLNKNAVIGCRRLVSFSIYSRFLHKVLCRVSWHYFHLLSFLFFHEKSHLSRLSLWVTNTLQVDMNIIFPCYSPSFPPSLSLSFLITNRVHVHLRQIGK